MVEEITRMLAAGAIVLLAATGLTRMFPRVPTWAIWASVAFLGLVVIPLTYEGPRTAALSILDTTPTWMIFAAAALLVVVVIPIAAFEEWRHTIFSMKWEKWKSVQDWWPTKMRYFDIPIREAIIHAANSTDHSYGSPSLRDRHFFEQLHKAMCSGELMVVGMKGESGALKRISRWKCRKLQPIEMVVPRNPSTPEGVRYCLVDKTVDLPEPLKEVEFCGFLGLRVRSQDLFSKWPKGKEIIS